MDSCNWRETILLRQGTSRVAGFLKSRNQNKYNLNMDEGQRIDTNDASGRPGSAQQAVSFKGLQK